MRVRGYWRPRLRSSASASASERTDTDTDTGNAMKMDRLGLAPPARAPRLLLRLLRHEEHARGLGPRELEMEPWLELELEL